MKALFTGITSVSLRFRWITLIIAALVSIAGVVAITQLRQELIPAVEFPQTIILAQASGMTSDQVLNLITKRLEDAISQVENVANVETSTTGAFGAVITARNDFGLNQSRIQSDIVEAINSVWLPHRRIAPPEGTDPQAFAQQLLGELPADVLIYIAESDPNFLFQLSPEVWSALSEDTVSSVLGYLASTQQDSTASNALQHLVEQEIVPALENLPQVANVQISGGQALPGEEGAQTAPPVNASDTESLLTQLSSEAWAAAAARIGFSGALNAQAVEALSAEVEIPETAPALPESWQMDRFYDASDLLEMRTLTRTVGATINQFLETGTIVGALGQTNDLTPDDITQMLAIDPTMADYFDAAQLAAMSPEAFAALPEDFVAGLDGFTRDALAARSLAEAITGESVPLPPVDLPSPWRLSPPQLITFSFDDLPLATLSISGSAGAETGAEPVETPVDETAAEPTETPAVENTTTDDIPEGPALPLPFSLMGGLIGIEMNTADDLINIQLPEEWAAQLGGSQLNAAQLLSFMLLLGNPDQLPEGLEIPAIPIDPTALIGGLSADVIAFLAEYDPTFLPNLSADVFESFNDDVLSLPQIAPPLDTVWDTLAEQPQFAEHPLNTAQDILALGDGAASSVLNAINAGVPGQFAGYEVRLFDSLPPATLRYFSLQEPGFYEALDPAVLLKLSPTTLAAIPEAVLAELPEDTQASITAIAAGEEPSAAAQLAELYTTDAPPADPNAPALNSDWDFIGDFMGIELDTADDFFRFLPDPQAFLNSLFDSAQGVAFAPNLFGNLPPEAAAYMSERDPALFDGLRSEAIQLLPDNVLAVLPASVQERAASGGEAFTPTDAITRTNGASSLLLTIYKSGDANTVEAFHAANDLIRSITASNPNIEVSVAFEQASFIEESISGVAREGGLGAIFAVVVILIFLSSGKWASTPRRITGAIMIGLFLLLLVGAVAINAGAAGGDFSLAWDQTDVLVRGILILGVLAGMLVMLWPGSLPRPAWRSTLVTGVSIPLSVLMAMALMRWLPPAVHEILEPVAEGSGIFTFLLRLFPESLTLNIMTLSGLTVAIGRVVDDSIVVLENMFRHLQEGGDRKTAILEGVRDVSVAIFAATVITVVVFLPLGLTGGIIGEFFLPFGLAVTYALLASFIVAITVIPVLAYMLLSTSEMQDEHEVGKLERAYLPVLGWSLSKRSRRATVLAIAFLSLVIGGALFATRPQAFLPSFGEPQISITVNLPPGTKILETNELVTQFEGRLHSDISEGLISSIQTTVGGSGASLESLVLGDTGVTENAASIMLGVEDAGRLDELAGLVRNIAVETFGDGNVTVSAASLTEQGFGGFALQLSGPQAELEAINARVIETLNQVDGLANVSSNLADLTGGGSDAPPTYIRIDGQPSVRYTGELETQDTLGVTAAAKAAVAAMTDMPAGITVSEGFESQLQTEGFANLFVAMGIAIAIVIVLLIITFRSFVHWLDIILSVIVAPVGAAVALTLTNRVLGISALIGMLMLIGIVVTNAVVLIDRVQSNIRERHMNVHDSLMEAGQRRLRPILMTAIATIMALIPLAIGLSHGAIIASELGTVVIGGLFSSTILTLIVVPVAFSLLEPLNRKINGLFGGSKKQSAPPAESAKS
ncbi:MAG: acriflavin resistance protein [Chloroflexi bacterium OLB15]|nr:MAG: acriflavin resistance protein [Chloroflexi bacterium OLB15]